MVKYTHKEMMKKLNGRKIYWEVFNQTKSDNHHVYYFDSYTDAKDYFDRCVARKAHGVLLTEFDKTRYGYYLPKTINHYSTRK